MSGSDWFALFAVPIYIAVLIYAVSLFRPQRRRRIPPHSNLEDMEARALTNLFRNRFYHWLELNGCTLFENPDGGPLYTAVVNPDRLRVGIAMLMRYQNQGSVWWENAESSRITWRNWEFYRDRRDWWIGVFRSGSHGSYFGCLTFIARRRRKER